MMNLHIDAKQDSKKVYRMSLHILKQQMHLPQHIRTDSRTNNFLLGQADKARALGPINIFSYHSKKGLKNICFYVI
jgi:hypothetical protein